jgi:hypothetical protein
MPIAFFIFFFAILFYSNKQKAKVLGRLSAGLRGSVSRFSFIPTFKGEYQGLNFSIELLSGGKNSPPCLKICLAKNFLFRLTIYKESFLSNIGKKLGVIHEVKINDEMFDRDFLVFSNKPAQAASYLNNSSVKNAIRELFSSGFNALFIKEKQILIQKPNYNLEIDINPQNITQTLQRLFMLARGG